MAQLDVYRDWLKIPDPERPLNHYQLLRLKKFEDDRAKIRSHYRKLNSHVRKYATGQYAEESQELLNELARAMLCLTDAKRKSEYDASMGRKDEARLLRSMEEILLSQQLVTREQLKKARSYADAIGLEVRDALVQQKHASAEDVTAAYAESIGLPYINLEDMVIDESLAPKVPAVLARQNSLMPILMDDERLLIASPNPIPPDVEEELRHRIGIQVRSVLCTPAQVNKMMATHYPREAADAEMASRSSQQGGSGGSVKQKSRAEMTPEEYAEHKKQQRMKVVLAFTTPFIFLMMLFMGLPMIMNWVPPGALVAYGIPLLVALASAGITWTVTK